MKLPPLVEATQSLSDAELNRYARHISLPGIGILGQERLKSAKILCIGAGGLGSPTLMYLAAAGVGTIGIIDFDYVDQSNLARQIIHSESSIGTLKTESAARRISEVNPNTQVQLHSEKLRTRNAIEIFSGYDLIIDGSDNFATRYLANDAAVLLKKPYIWGSIFQFDGQASVFWAEHGPCYRCLQPTPPPPGTVPSCSVAGVLGLLCSSISAIQSTEAIKLITGVGDPLIGSVIIYDALRMDFQKIVVKKDPACPLCGSNPIQFGLLENYEDFCGESPAITASELKRKMDEKVEFQLIDVREIEEFERARIPGSTLIPLGQFKDGTAFALIRKDLPIILHCRSGVRSATALKLLAAEGFDGALHLAGGIIEWIKDVDPSLSI